jgi:hypothetical protein
MYTEDANGLCVRRKGDTIKHPAKWLGSCNETKEYIDLAKAWVVQNFDEHFLVQVMSCTKSTSAFIQVPFNA